MADRFDPNNPSAWQLYGDRASDGPRPDQAADFDDTAVQAIRAGACIRSGNCCLKMPCPVAQMRGAKAFERCPWLRGDTPGAYACELIEQGAKDILHGPWSVGAGEGCAEPHNSDRLQAGRNRTARRRAGEEVE
jgi:hypothetical protein